jgi:preprotein translocase subunit SecB
MGPSPFTLERAFFSKVLIETSLAQGAEPTKSIKSKIKTAKAPSDPLRFQVSLSITLAKGAEQPAAYYGEVDVVGLFRISDEIAPEERERKTAIHGATLLFGMAREMICTITARGPWPMFVLPVVSFAELHKSVTDPNPTAAAEHVSACHK